MHSVFEDQFDIRNYTEKRLLEVGNLDDRRLLKNVLGNLFFPYYEHIEGEYQRLEDRIFSEYRPQTNDYAIVTGIADRALYDVTDRYLVPMDDTDLTDGEVDLGVLYDSIDSSLPYFLYNVFLEADYLEVKAFAKSGRCFSGTVRTAEKAFQAQFYVKETEKYKQQIESLSQVFVTNNLPWQTVCCPYLHKLFSVFLCAVEGWEHKEPIDSVQVDFGIFAPRVRYHFVPLWNITPIEVKTSAYPEPCADRTNYDHMIYLQKIDPNAQYLVANQDYGITNIRRVKDDLLITCSAEKPMLWKLYKMNREALQAYRYPLLSNQKKDSFIDHYAETARQAVKTKAEISRLLSSYFFDDYIAFSDLAIVEKATQDGQTYDMDYFIKDEIRISGGKWKMLFYFYEKNGGYFLNRDIMSFLVTQVQKFFPEYECGGIIASD